MRLEKIEEGEETTNNMFCDFINCGACYLIAEWINRKNATVTLSQDTILEDLQGEHGGSINYSKLCGTTFHQYVSDDRKTVLSSNLDEVLNWTKTSNNDWYYYPRLLKALITGEGLEKPFSSECIVRWPKDGGSSRGIDWYGVFND